jgi:hypothetical protein
MVDALRFGAVGLMHRINSRFLVLAGLSTIALAQGTLALGTERQPSVAAAAVTTPHRKA